MLHRTQTTAGHVLTFAQTLAGGGSERAMLRLAGGWLAQGRRMTLVLGKAEGPLAAELPGGIAVREVGSGDYRALMRAIPGIVRERVPDLIFCPGNHYSGTAAYARLRLGRLFCPPILGKVSNSLIRPDLGPAAAWAYRRWLRLHPLFLDHVVAMTPATAAEAVREMRIAPERVSVIPNLLAVPMAGAEYPLPAGRFLLGVGRLEPQKRWDRLIEALPRLAAHDMHLLILGEGSGRAALEAQIGRLGLGARVSLPGHVGDPTHALRRAAALVLTSDYEGVPGVLREALAVGTPVVATDSSVSVREIVSAPELGTIVPREDGDALVAALDQWLAPGAARPAPVTDDGDPIADYLALFDRLVAQRKR